MSKQVPSKEQLLSQQLHREAIETRPMFSESLHEQILRAVEQSQANTETAESVPLLRRSSADDIQSTDHPIHRRWPRAIAVAACTLLAIAIGGQLLLTALRHTSGQKAPISQPSLAQLPSINDLTDHTVGRLDRLCAIEPQTTPLKNDAYAVASVFLDRLPVAVKTDDKQ